MKNRKQWCRENSYWLWSLLLTILMGTVIFGIRGLWEQTAEVVCLGDSMIGSERGDTSIPALLEEQLSVRAYNGAFGGTTAALRDQSLRGASAMDHFSLSALSQAVCLEDFGVQNAGIEAWEIMNFYPGDVQGYREGLQGLDKIDFDETKVLVIEHGVNDYLAGVPLENPENPYDPYTFGGALRSSLQLLQERYPQLRIILMTPTYCWLLDSELTCEEADFGGGILEDYVNLELAIAKELSVEVVDNYHHSGIGMGTEFARWEIYTYDGLHLNEAGRRLVAKRLADCIETKRSRE